MINNATSEILVVTDELSHEFSEDLERKAISGVKTRVMSPDTEWARWLENRVKSYGLDEESRLESDIKKTNNAVALYKRIPYLTLTVVVALVIIELVRSYRLDALLGTTIIAGAIATVLSFVYFRKKSRELEYEISIKQQELENIRSKVEDSRKRLSNNLNVIELDTRLNFSVIMADGKAIITSMLLKYSDEGDKKLEFEEEVPLEFVKLILEKLTPSQL